MPFPADFLWGAATASYQIEGAVREDGRGERSGTASANARPDQGRRHRRRRLRPLPPLAERTRADAELGLTAYRFSVAWPRVLPEGRGTRQPAGLDFYDRLVDGLLERGIEPVVTLYHWDLPQALEGAARLVSASTSRHG